jgi:hypothetical protein
VEIKEHYLWNFVHWVRLSRAGDSAAELLNRKKTLEHVAELVERILEGENPLPKKRGRKSNSDTMWLCFHMVGVVPFASDSRVPRYSPIKNRGRRAKGAVDLIAASKLLHAEYETVRSNYYKARDRWKTREGRQEYIDWLNRREKIWEACQARDEKREPAPREYVLSTVINSVICVRLDEQGNPDTVYLSPEEVSYLVNEAGKKTTFADKNDYENWSSNRGRFLYIPALFRPSKAGRKRRNM